MSTRCERNLRKKTRLSCESRLEPCFIGSRYKIYSTRSVENNLKFARFYSFAPKGRGRKYEVGLKTSLRAGNRGRH